MAHPMMESTPPPSMGRSLTPPKGVVVVASPSSSPSSSSPGALGLPFTKRQLNQGRRYLWQNTQRILITCMEEEPPCRGGNYDLLPSETVAGMPSELLLHICSLLDGASLLSVSLTCARWRHLLFAGRDREVVSKSATSSLSSPMPMPATFPLPIVCAHSLWVQAAQTIASTWDLDFEWVASEHTRCHTTTTDNDHDNDNDNDNAPHFSSSISRSLQLQSLRVELFPATTSTSLPPSPPSPPPPPPPHTLSSNSGNVTSLVVALLRFQHVTDTILDLLDRMQRSLSSVTTTATGVLTDPASHWFRLDDLFNRYTRGSPWTSTVGVSRIRSEMTEFLQMVAANQARTGGVAVNLSSESGDSASPSRSVPSPSLLSPSPPPSPPHGSRVREWGVAAANTISRITLVEYPYGGCDFTSRIHISPLTGFYLPRQKGQGQGQGHLHFILQFPSTWNLDTVQVRWVGPGPCYHPAFDSVGMLTLTRPHPYPHDHTMDSIAVIPMNNLSWASSVLGVIGSLVELFENPLYLTNYCTL